MYNDLDLNLLTALDALLQERHVTRAANKVALSEPAMSRALHRLRLTFRDELLVRMGREYSLTELAEQLKEPVHEILEKIAETVIIRPTFDPATDAREFTVATSDYGSFLVLRPLAKVLVRQAPSISLKIVRLHRESFMDLQAARIDLMISRRPEDHELHGEILFEDRWCCAVTADHPDIGETITTEDYMSQPHLRFRGNRAIDRALEELGEAEREPVTIPSEFLVPLFLAGTPMITMVPERTGRQIAELMDIKLLAAPFSTPSILLKMCWHPRSQSNPAHSWLRERIREVCAEATESAFCPDAVALST